MSIIIIHLFTKLKDALSNTAKWAYFVTMATIAKHSICSNINSLGFSSKLLRRRFVNIVSYLQVSINYPAVDFTIKTVTRDAILKKYHILTLNVRLKTVKMRIVYQLATKLSSCIILLVTKQNIAKVSSQGKNVATINSVLLLIQMKS